MVALLGSMTKSHLKKVSDERLPTRSTPAHFPKTPYLHPPPSRSAASASPMAGTTTRQTPYYERHNSWTRTDPFATPYLAAEPAPIPTNRPLSETSSPVPIPTSHRGGPPSSSSGTGGRGHDRQRNADGKTRHTPSGHASPTGSAPAVQASIYDQYKTARHPFANPPLFVTASPTVKYTSEGVVDIDALDDEASHFRAAADPTAPPPLPHSHSKTPADDQSASAQQRDRKLSRASSFEFAVWSPSSTTTDLPSIVEMDADTAPRSRTSTMTHRPSPLGPGSAPAGSKGADAQESGYDTAASATNSAYRRRGPTGIRAGRIGATDAVSESGEHDEEKDQLHQLRDYRNSKLHSLTNLDARFNQSALSVGSRVKADKILGLEPNVTLASLYLVSGLGREPEQWSLSDADATRGVQTLDDSMGIFWRPEVLGNAFAGDTIDSFTDLVKDPKGTVRNGTKLNPSLKNRVVPDAGPDGARKLISKAVKFAHPRDLEVVNSTLAPPSTCHAFSFTLPRVDTLAAIARTRLDSALPDRPLSELDTTFDTSMMSSTSMPAQAAPSNLPRGSHAATEIQYHGVTLTCWMHVDAVRLPRLKQLKQGKKMASGLGSVASAGGDSIKQKISKRRSGMPWKKGGNASEAEGTGSETEAGATDSEMEGPLGRKALKNAMKFNQAAMEDLSLPMAEAPVFDEAGDVFWLPYSITLVSRFPLYDTMQDFLRLSWAKYSKQAKLHMSQVLKILNAEPPRPGEKYSLTIGLNSTDETTLEASMPGALDFDKGLVKVDMQLWPLFQALDLDHILFCIDIALSNSGRIVFSSKHVAMLNVAVNALKYIVEMRGWEGLAVPVLHARDVTLLIEDPGPYIIGISSECRYVVVTPPEVVMVDLDTNSVICKTPPANVITPKHKRDKSRAKIMQALGPAYPSERSIPMEYKVSYPTGSFKNFNKIYDTATRDRPRYLGERFRVPSWWKHAEVMSTFDKIMVDKHKKPTLIQRLTRSGISRPEAQLSVGEQLAKRMMRKRALHYVETRDDLELKVARINRRLLKLMQEGEHVCQQLTHWSQADDKWKQQFETFEKYADRLAHEANDLKLKIERERREAKRLSTLANEQTKAKDELEDRLQKTEDARAEAMRQLSEMHISIQELEREREEIMDVFEMQINTALQVMPPGSPTPSSRPSTPGTSALSVASSRPQVKGLRQRPTTKDSALSQLSRLTDGTVRSRSIMDALDRASGRQGSSIVDRDALPPADRVIFDRTDAIASRIVSIQQKLQLALDSVTTGQSGSLERSTSIASRISTSAGAGGDQTLEGGSGTASSLPANGLGLEGEDVTPVSHAEAMSTPRGPMAVQGLQVEEADPDSVSISSEALTEKGRARSQYNTTPPPEMPTVDRLKDFKLKPSRSPVRSVDMVAVQPAKSDKDELVSEQESESGMTTPSMLVRRSGTDGSLSVDDEVLVSPSPSKGAFDMAHHEGADPAGQFEDAEGEGPKKGNDGTSKRFSGMSTATVAFG